MWASTFYQSMLTDLLQKAVLDLVKQLPHQDNLEVDGIVAISSKDCSKQLVLKVHKFINGESPSSIVKTIYSPGSGGSLKTISLLKKKLSQTTAVVDNDGTLDLSIKKASPKISPKKKEPATKTPTHGGKTPTQGIKTPTQGGKTPTVGLKIPTLLIKAPVTATKAPFAPSELVISEVHSLRSDVDSPGPEVDDKLESSKTKGNPAHGILKEILSKPPPGWNKRHMLSQDEIKREVESPEQSMSQIDSLENSMCESDDYQSFDDEDMMLPDSKKARYDTEHGESSSTTLTCKICSTSFLGFPSLQQHALHLHKRYTCKVCYNTFSLRCNLRRHERLHAGVKPYSCDICRKTFSRGTDLKMHLSKHGLQKLPNWVTCSKCPKMFANAVNLRIHMYKVHREKESVYACSICEQVFHDADKFQEHRESHTASLVQHGQVFTPRGGTPVSDDGSTEGTVPANITASQNSILAQVLNDAVNSTSTPKAAAGQKHHSSATEDKTKEPQADLAQIISNIVESSLVGKTKHKNKQSDKPRSPFTPINRQEPFRESSMSPVQSIPEMPQEGPRLLIIKPETDYYANSEASSAHTCDEENKDKELDGLVPQPVASLKATQQSGRKRKSTPVRHVQVEAYSHDDEDSDVDIGEEEDRLYIDETQVARLEPLNERSPDSPDVVGVVSELDLEKALHSTSYEVASFVENCGPEDTSEAPDGYSSTGEGLGNSMNSGSMNLKSLLNTSELSESQIQQGYGQNGATNPLNNSKSGASKSSSRKAGSKRSRKSVGSGGTKSPGGNASLLEVSLSKDEEYVNKEYTCEQWGCKLTIRGFESYEDHCLSVHGRFPCCFCSQTFSGKNNRTRHMRFHVTGKRYSCPDCGKKFARPDSLKEHKFIHTNSYRDSWCKNCGSTFERKAALLSHMKKCFTNEQLEEDRVANNDTSKSAGINEDQSQESTPEQDMESPSPGPIAYSTEIVPQGDEEVMELSGIAVPMTDGIVSVSDHL